MTVECGCREVSDMDTKCKATEIDNSLVRTIRYWAERNLLLVTYPIGVELSPVILAPNKFKVWNVDIHR